jgi:deoxyribonuclease-4
MARGLASVIHSPYPTNIAGFAPHEEKFALTVASVRNDLEIANACGSLGVVVHVGAVRSHDAVEGYRNVVLALDAVLAGYQGTAQVLLENQAQGLGMALSEILQVRALCQQPQHIALCVDTCHLFASGAWDGQAQAAWMHDPQITPHVAVIHLNDSRYEAGSHRDRHAALGEGYIGEAGLAAVVQQLREVPLVLETPDGKVGVDAQLTRVREWGDVQK